MIENKDLLINIANEKRCVNKKDFKNSLNFDFLKGIEEIVYGPESTTLSAQKTKDIINKKEKKIINKSQPWIKEFSKKEIKKQEVRPHWQIISKGKGFLFAKKELPNKTTKHMDILKGFDEDNNRKYKSIIVYESGNKDNQVLVRTKREPLNKKIRI